MRISIHRAIPGLCVTFVTLLAALPWGLPPEARFVLPLMPYTVIHYWAVRRPGLMPEWLVFLSGLATDVLTHGPLGFWSLIFLSGFVAIQVSRPLSDINPIVRWLHFAATLVFLGALQWLIASAYFMDAGIEWRPLARSVVVIALVYPLIALLFQPIERLWLRTDTSMLARGV
jgi:rod shape-determining protein MreD